MYRIFPSISATAVQATAYLLGVALFSISFLVFLNASISFVVTDVIGRRHGVGDVVGTLGFADELLALVACPVWGILSDRIGVRYVAVLGYLIIGLSLFLLVQARNAYPQLLLGRLLFSLGAAACSTMVTAILPAMTIERTPHTKDSEEEAAESTRPDRNSLQQPPAQNVRNSGAFSISSELTITPARYVSHSPTPGQDDRRQSYQYGQSSEKSANDVDSGVSQLAGFVGLFTGLGALLAVAVFLPLPYLIGKNDLTRTEAVKDAFYIVGAAAFCVSIFIFFGLRRLPGEEGKGFSKIFTSGAHRQQQDDESLEEAAAPTPSYLLLIKSAVMLGFTDSRIALGYLGGFVARASSVGISLFIPLFVNAYYIRHGKCTSNPSEDTKSNCKGAYVTASMLTGFSQLAALLCAPIFGWFNGCMNKNPKLANLPLGLGTVAGIAGCVAFGMLDNPDPFSKEDRSGRGAILAVILLGISQIAAIVCSLGTLAKGIRGATIADAAKPQSEVTASAEGNGNTTHHSTSIEPAETAPLLVSSNVNPPQSTTVDVTKLKGTIAGVYSLAGGAGILLLTKLGGVLFDKNPGAPFYMLAGFNGMLLVAVVAISIGQNIGGSKQAGS